MWEWTQRRPHRSVKIGPRDVAWAEEHRDWRGRVHYRSAVASLPDGMIRLSPLEPNVLNPEDLQARIRGLAAPVKRLEPGKRDLLGGLPRAVTLETIDTSTSDSPQAQTIAAPGGRSIQDDAPRPTTLRQIRSVWRGT